MQFIHFKNIKTRIFTKNNCFKLSRLFSLFAIFMVLAFIQPGLDFTSAAPVDISDAPLDVQLQAAAPNIMFGIDDSGSMDWEIMTNEETGLFEIGNKDYEYVFDDPGDQLYTSGTYSDNISSDDRLYYKSQYFGYNVMYYNPSVQYNPWHSGMPNADVNNVRSHPYYAENYVNLNSTYYSMSDASNTVIIDDDNKQRTSSSSNWDEWSEPNAYEGKDKYTTVVGETFTWEPDLSSAGNYDVYVFNAFYGGNDKNAEYTIVHAGGISTAYSNQYDDAGTWDLLGTYNFNSGKSGSVTVTRKDHPDKLSYTNADAVKFVKSGAGGIDIINAHYYTWSASEGAPYLVILDGDIKYYKFTDSDGDDFIDEGELALTATPPADIVTGRTYAAERQNFANWYSFYRKRWYTSIAALCEVLNSLDGFNVGIRSLNGYIKQPVVAVNVGGVNEKALVLEKLTSFRHNKNPQGSTPLRQGMRKIGQYFNIGETISPKETEFETSPLESGATGACQQNFVIMFTDGAYNGTAPGLGNIDGSYPAPYADNNSGSFADTVMYYWANDLDGDSSNNQVPTNFFDDATWQHLVTYVVGFGVEGTLNPSDYDLYNIVTENRVYPTWPSPINSDKKRIDDLWHGAVNGRGIFLNASNPMELVEAFKSIINDVIARVGSGAKVSINAEELSEGTVIYQSSYSTEFWSGDVKAYGIDVNTGQVLRGEGDELWSSGEKVSAQDWNTGRNIATFSGTAGIPFRFNSLDSGQKTALDADPVRAEKMLNYLRGDRTYEGSDFRARETILGDFVHSAPLFHKDVLYVGGNDGMLHAFNAKKTGGGGELFAYVPGLVFGNLNLLASPAYSHRYFVDLTPSIAVIEGKTYLVGGCGKGAKGYFCLDISNPETITTETILASRAKWEFPGVATATGDIADMGFSFSRPIIVNTKAGWVVIFGNGYNSTNEDAALFILSIDGGLLKKITTGSGPSNGLSTPSVIDVDNDRLADFVFAGDLLGNVWKFDIQASSASGWDVSYRNESGGAEPLFKASGPSGSIQPITTKPDVMYHCEKHGYLVLFGTGKYLGNSDFSDTSTQSIYGIWDYGDDTDTSEYLGGFDRSNLPNLSNQPDTVTLLEQVQINWDSGGSNALRIISDNPATWFTVKDDDEGEKNNPSNLSPNHAGWFFDLPISKERIIRDVVIRGGVAIVISTIPKSSPCTAGGESILHELDACSGARLGGPQFDTNGDGLIDENDKVDGVPPSGMHFQTMIYEPAILRINSDDPRELKLMSTASGGIVGVREVGEERGMFYWRQIH